MKKRFLKKLDLGSNKGKILAKDLQGDQMICSKNAQNLAKNARHSAHHNFTRKCPKCPIFSLFPASSPPKMPTFMPKQKTRIPFFAQNIVKFCIFWAGPDNFWKCPKKGPGPTMVFSASKPFKMPDMGRNAHFWSPCLWAKLVIWLCENFRIVLRKIIASWRHLPTLLPAC